MHSIYNSIQQYIFTISQSYYQKLVNFFLRVWLDTWTDRKFSTGKLQSKSEESYHTDNSEINCYWV